MLEYPAGCGNIEVVPRCGVSMSLRSRIVAMRGDGIDFASRITIRDGLRPS